MKTISMKGYYSGGAILLRTGKLLIALALLAVAHSAYANTCESRFPLSTEGRYIVDACGDRFKLKAGNWYGASGSQYPDSTAHHGGVDTHEIPYGLDRKPLTELVGMIQQLGLNSVRLPFSNEIIHKSTPIPDSAVAANPQLQGKNPLEVYDAVVEALTSAGIAVILNNHTSSSKWCCNYDENGLWHNVRSDGYQQSSAQWVQDWVDMVTRYKDNKMVIGADLRNEIRTVPYDSTGAIFESPNWADGDDNSWWNASMWAGDRILTEASSDILIIVEGINWWGSLPAFGGERPHLKPAKDLSVQLKKSNKLVYGAHNYGYIGPNSTGAADGPGSWGSGPQYRDMDKATLYSTLDSEWGFALDSDKMYTAPVWVSEFGINGVNNSAEDRAWFANLVDYMIDRDLDFAYWPIFENSDWALTEQDLSGLKVTKTSDTRKGDWERLIAHNGVQGPVTPAASFTQLAMPYSNWNFNKSMTIGDWDGGANKATCPDGQRLVGLSHSGHRGLCSDVATGDLWSADKATSTVTVYEGGVGSHGSGDWAGGFTKYECPAGYYASGYSKRWWGTSGVHCSKANKTLSNICHTIWFDQGDNRASSKGGDWAQGHYKGQVADDEYVAGIAQRDGDASALLACKVDLPEYFSLKNRKSGLCLDVSGGGTANGTNVQSWSCNGSDAQKWKYEPSTGFIRSKLGKCLHNHGGNSSGNNVTLWDCTNQSNFRFDFDGEAIRARDYWSIAIDAYGTWSGANVGQWWYHGGSNQKWQKVY